MIDDVPGIAPPLVRAETPPPAADVAPPGEATMPEPTAEQMADADRLCSAAVPNHLATLLGVATSIALLRDVAVDTFDTTGADDEEKAKPDEKPKSVD